VIRHDPTRPTVLVGIAADIVVRDPTERPDLFDLLRALDAAQVDVRVALLGDGPLRIALEPLVEVRVLEPLPPRSAGGVAEAAARRLSGGLADRLFDARSKDDLAWLGRPDAIHLRGPFAAPLLRHLRDAEVPVTTYVHPLDHKASGLTPAHLGRLLDRTTRWIVPAAEAALGGEAVDGGAVTDLVTVGVARERIVVAPPEIGCAPAVADADERSATRQHLGVADDETVVAVLPVPDWVDCPELTLPMTWELERRLGERAPTVLWTGMPEDGDRRWPIDVDRERMGIRSLRLTPDEAEWTDLVGAADVVVLPLRHPGVLPDDFAAYAADRGRPVLAWASHPRAEEIAATTGTVVPRGDVAAMAEAIGSMVADADALARARRVGWAPHVADLEVLVPLEVPAP
jgi:hypothetical protein